MNEMTFLVADTQLYERLCPSVRQYEQNSEKTSFLNAFCVRMSVYWELGCGHKCMAWNLKGPSANSFKSDRASSSIEIISYSVFPNLKFTLMKEMAAKFDRKTQSFSFFPYVCLFSSCFIFSFIIFCLQFLKRLQSDMGLSRTNGDVG